MSDDETPWKKLRAQTWDATIGGIQIKFRESGSVSALVEIIFGSHFQVSAEDREAAVAQLVTSSIIDPILTREEFHAMGIPGRFELLSEILAHVKVDKDFFGVSAAGTKVKTEPETSDGGSGEPRKLSVSIRQSPSPPPSGSSEASKPSST